MHHKSHPFKIYNLEVFSIFTVLCNHHHCQVPQYFYHPQKKPHTP